MFAELAMSQRRSAIFCAMSAWGGKPIGRVRVKPYSFPKNWFHGLWTSQRPLAWELSVEGEFFLNFIFRLMELKSALESKMTFSRKYRRLDKPPYTYVALTALAIQFLDRNKKTKLKNYNFFLSNFRHFNLHPILSLLQINDCAWPKFLNEFQTCFHFFEILMLDGKIRFDIIFRIMNVLF